MIITINWCRIGRPRRRCLIINRGHYGHDEGLVAHWELQIFPPSFKHLLPEFRICRNFDLSG